MRRLLLAASLGSLALMNACAGGQTDEVSTHDAGDSGFGTITPGWDSGAQDSTVEDTGTAVDSTIADSSDSDGSMGDTGIAGDESGADSAVADSGDDTTIVDSGADTFVADTGSDTGSVVDSGADTKDSGVADTGVADTGVADTGSDAGCTKSGVCECSDQADCAGTAFKCGGPSSCGGTPCFTCNNATGSGGPWAACADTSGCASGLCDDNRGHCSAPCKLTSATVGDADCVAAMGAGFVCTEATLTISSKSATLGYCAKKCTRNADCGSGGDLCELYQNDSFNRYDAVCGAPGTGAGRGTVCTKSDDCASGICLNTGTTSYCSALCTTATVAADCGGTVSKCSKISQTLPAGGTQAIFLCTP